MLNISPPKHLQSIFNEFNNTSNNYNDEEFSINCKYYDVESFNTSKFKSKDYFSIFHLNIASLSKHKTDLETLLALLNFEFNIIAITETKILKNCQPTFDLTLQNYTLFQTPTESNSGGAILYISNNINCKLRKDLQIYKSKELESVFVEIINPKKNNTIIGCIYRHPCMEIENFNDNYFEPLLKKLSHENKNIFLAGDYNINLLHSDTNEQTSTFLNNLSSNLFIPHIILPTRITSKSKTLIDNIFSNSTNFTSFVSGNLTSTISDHLPQFLLLPNINDKHLPKKHNFYIRNTKQFDRENFLFDLFEII